MLANGEWGAFDVEKCVREHDWMEGVNSHEIKVGDNLFSMTDGASCLIEQMKLD